MARDDVEPLITECPNCQTRFRVTEGQLQIAAGRVRCGACLTVFPGVEHLLWDGEPRLHNETDAGSALDDLLSELGEPAPGNGSTDADDEVELPDLDALGNDAISISDEPDAAWSQPEHQLYGGHEDPPDLEPLELADEDIEELVIDQVADYGALPVDEDSVEENVADERPPQPKELEPQDPQPEELEPAATQPFTFGDEPRKGRWWIALATMAAIIALAAQVLWYQFEVWARDPDIRPIYVLICDTLECELPILRDVDAMLAQNLVVRSHTEIANALLVDAVIINQAAFAQPFPVLELRFTDINGGLVAGRRFQPSEYLAGELAGATVMPPWTPIHVGLAIEDPGESAVNYFLSFR